MKIPNLIGICGNAESGKDTVASMLQHLYGFSVHTPKSLVLATKNIKETITSKYSIKSFATPIKEKVAELINIPVHSLERREVKDSYYIPERKDSVWDNSLLPEEIINQHAIYYKIDTVDKLNRYTSKPLAIKVRVLLQLEGEEHGRQIYGNDVWVNYLFKNYDPKFSNWIIKDVRYVNEAKRIKTLGGIILEKVGLPKDIMPHNSETEISKIDKDIIIPYFKDKEELAEYLINLIKSERNEYI